MGMFFHGSTGPHSYAGISRIEAARLIVSEEKFKLTQDGCPCSFEHKVRLQTGEERLIPVECRNSVRR